MSLRKIVDPCLLFQFACPLRQLADRNPETLEELAPEYILPHLAVLSGQESVAEVRCGWSPEGMYFQIQSLPRKRRFPPRLRAMQLWIDTRPSPDVQRGTQYCTLINTEKGSEELSSYHEPPDPEFCQGYIRQSRQSPSRFDWQLIRHHYEKDEQSYRLRLWLPAETLHGYSPIEFPEMGLFYEVCQMDDEYQTFSIYNHLRYEENPSSWVRVNLEA